MNKRILVAEDQKELQELYKTVLESEGHNIDIAENGQDGLDLTILNNYDMIISDYEMPEMNGLTMARELRFNHGYFKPILIHTGGDLKSIENELLSINVYGANKGGVGYIREFVELEYIVNGE